MLNYDDINMEIKRLEDSELTYQNCAKLANLYVIMDHKSQTQKRKSFGSSEFAQAVAKAPIEDVIDLLDEHMKCIQALYPKEYSSIINRIKEMSL